MMTLVIIAVAIVTSSYLFFICLFIYGILKKQTSEPGIKSTVAVIVAFRNERNNLLPLIQSLKNQSFPPHEIILVNDNSTDLNEFIFPPEVTLVNNTGIGKKNAIITGVNASRSEILVFTDADCKHAHHWMEDLAAGLNNASLVCGAVVPANMQSFFAFDDISITGATMGALQAGYPFACSGAGMACRKTDFLKWNPYQNNLHQPSGDDVFLMRACLRHKQKVKAVTGSENLVYHKNTTSLLPFLIQRIRWAQKTGTSNIRALIIGITVTFYCSIFYLGLAMCLINLKAALICGFSLIIGAVVNFLLLFLVALRWKLRPYWLLFLPAFVFHLGYIPVVALLAKIWPVTWKGRKLRGSIES
jgi:cellulose synthase/poly-beta-1,6-N-acetylglucosamine synthase-like glycosyltransferase